MHFCHKHLHKLAQCLDLEFVQIYSEEACALFFEDELPSGYCLYTFYIYQNQEQFKNLILSRLPNSAGGYRENDHREDTPHFDIIEQIIESSCLSSFQARNHKNFAKIKAKKIELNKVNLNHKIRFKSRMELHSRAYC